MSPEPGSGMPDEQWPEHRPDKAGKNQPAAATPQTPGGTNHGAPLKRSAIHGKGDAPSDLTPHAHPEAEWQRAEQISESSIVQQNKLAATGSVGLAKHQADTAAERAEKGQTHSAPAASQKPSAANRPPATPQPGGPPSPVAGNDPRAETSTGQQATSAAPPAAAFPAGKASSKDDLAQRHGFASFLEFFEGSQPVGSEPNNVWFTSALPQNQWIVWNSQTLEFSRPLPSLHEAQQLGHIAK